jgi:hypothetical protein
MKPYFRVIILALLIFFGFLAVRQAYGTIDEGIFSGFQYTPFVFLIVTGSTALLLDIKYFWIDKKPSQFISSFVGLVLLTIVISRFNHNKSIDNSKTILLVLNLPQSSNGLRFEFKEKGNFRLTEYDLLGQTISYGSYSRNKDTINILNSNYNGYATPLPKSGIVSSDTIYWKGFDTMLVEHLP